MDIKLVFSAIVIDSFCLSLISLVFILQNKVPNTVSVSLVEFESCKRNSVSQTQWFSKSSKSFLMITSKACLWFKASWWDSFGLRGFYKEIHQIYLNNFCNLILNNTTFYQWSFDWGLRWLSHLSNGLPPLIKSRIWVLVWNIWSHVGRVRQHSAKGPGFSPGSLVFDSSSQRENSKGGPGLIVKEMRGFKW